jgi:hypothetical protein
MVKTKQIDKNQFLGYEKKAYHAFETMKLALDNKLWTAAGREAVFVCINMTDALLAKHNGLRNVSKDHMDVVKVVATILPMSDRKNQSHRLRKVIQMKNLIDYESREFSEKSANEIARQATRFYEWGCQHL